jgi:hypothetical protein
MREDRIERRLPRSLGRNHFSNDREEQREMASDSKPSQIFMYLIPILLWMIAYRIRVGAWDFSTDQAGQAETSNRLIPKGRKKSLRQKNLLTKFDVKSRPIVITS